MQMISCLLSFDRTPALEMKDFSVRKLYGMVFL